MPVMTRALILAAAWLFVTAAKAEDPAPCAFKDPCKLEELRAIEREGKERQSLIERRAWEAIQDANRERQEREAREAEEARRRQEAAQEAQRQRQAADEERRRRQEADRRAIADLKARREVEELARIKRERDDDLASGYQPTSHRDFALDGEQMAQDNKRITVYGAYSRAGDMRWLYTTGGAITMEADLEVALKIPLLIDQSTDRMLRSHLLDCDGIYDCVMALRGQVTTCEVTFLGAVANRVPCVHVESGRIESHRDLASTPRVVQ